ncbi:MAG: IclR family transcriptional regulator [Pseudorhodobacter sp.]
MSGRGAERVLQLVEWLADQVNPVSLTDAVKSLSLPKSSALALLRILNDAGYVRRQDDGRYLLVRRPGEPTATGRGHGTLLRCADAYLRGAVEKSGESGFIATLDDDLGVQYIAKILPSREIRYDRNIDVPRRPHQVSSGIILLGGLTDAGLDAYITAEVAAGRLVEAGAAQLRADIARARSTGIWLSRKGVVEGAGGMAAPIRNRDGEIVAAINIAGPSSRLSAAAKKIEPILRQAADAISASLGWLQPHAAGLTSPDD